MSDPSINDIVKGDFRKSTAIERDWWNRARAEERNSILAGKNLDTGFINETASENAYQQDYTARYNQLIKTNYDSLPVSIKSMVTETLIEQGELPDPSDFKGIGNEFIANTRGLEKEIFIECDRCDESFMDDEDFTTHKDITHGDKVESNEEAEDEYLASMDPDASKEELKEARKIVAETDEGDLHRSVYFNGDKLPKATVTEPDLPKGKVGYDDNPNKFFYDNKIFKKGKASSRQDGSVTEADTDDHDSERKQVGISPVTGEPAYKTVEEVENDGELHKHDYDIEGNCKTCGKSMDQVRDGEARANEEGLEPQDDPNDKFEQVDDNSFWNGKIGEEADNYPQKDGGTEDEWKDTLTGLKNDYEGHENDVDYKQDGLSDIDAVPAHKEDDDPAKTLEDVDFSEESIDFVYPTKKFKASEVEAVDDFLDGYGDDDIENDKEAVEAQIIDRKLRGYGAETIARELVMQYGVSHEEALEKAYSIEVSTNDKVANTFFGKRFNECTEAEIEELKLYGGSD